MIDNIDKFYNSREGVFNFYGDYTKIMFDSNYQAKQDKTKGAGLKILTPKQMLQRLPIALAQLKAGNNSESLLNEIKLFILCINQKKSLKKYTIT